MHIHKRPIVQAGSFEVSVAKGEAQRLNEVKGEIEASAEPGDVAGVGWYFRLIEYNFHKTPLASKMTWGLASNELAPADFTMIHHDPMDLALGIFNPGLSFF
jgi:hypothetical protein